MNLFSMIKSLINKTLTTKPKKQEPAPFNASSIQKEVERARALAEAARQEAAKAKAEASASKLDANIATLKAHLPIRAEDSQECTARYGGFIEKDGSTHWMKERDHCSTLLIADEFSANWINSATGKPTTKIYCNKDLHVPLMLALHLLKKKNLLPELKTFDGCFVVRKQRGGTNTSYHSWAIAIDINAKDNKLGDTPTLSKEFVDCWKEAGWIWGGDWKRKDGMHFQYVTKG